MFFTKRLKELEEKVEGLETKIKQLECEHVGYVPVCGETYTIKDAFGIEMTFPSMSLGYVGIERCAKCDKILATYKTKEELNEAKIRQRKREIKRLEKEIKQSRRKGNE